VTEEGVAVPARAGTERRWLAIRPLAGDGESPRPQAASNPEPALLNGATVRESQSGDHARSVDGTRTLLWTNHTTSAIRPSRTPETGTAHGKVPKTA
jgi:hypothetical protein